MTQAGREPDAAQFRHALGHFPTGVVVVTADCDGEPVGMAVGSFSSVSLDPLLVGFFADRSSSTWPRVRSAGSFCANVLGEAQEDVCRTFAARGVDRFAMVDWSPGLTGAPILAGAPVHIECDIADVLPAGDHELVLGRVVDLRVDSAGGPLVFHRGGYARVTSG
jgi:flavin reductase (DIM6/NTAB) family NADH-FMN oxidoreductase RutF